MEKDMYVMLGFAIFILIIIILAPIINCVESSWKGRGERLPLLQDEENAYSVPRELSLGRHCEKCATHYQETIQSQNDLTDQLKYLTDQLHYLSRIISSLNFKLDSSSLLPR